MKKIVADCFNCDNMLFLGNTQEGVCICLRHKVQIEPNLGLHCQFWKKGGNFHDCLHADNAMERSKQENDQSLSDEE